MDLHVEGVREAVDGSEDPLGGNARTSVIRLVTEGGVHHINRVAESLDSIVLELHALFGILNAYMIARNDFIRDLSHEVKLLKSSRAQLHRVVDSGTYSLLFGRKYVTAKAKAGQVNLDSTEADYNAQQSLLSLLKLPIRAHVSNSDILKQYPACAHLLGELDKMAAIIVRINQYIAVAQADFDRVHPVNDGLRAKSKGIVIPLAAFKRRLRRVYNLEQVWEEAFLRPVMAMHEPQCRRDVPEGMPLWDIYEAWAKPWENSRR